jgi:hypothetical protein
MKKSLLILFFTSVVFSQSILGTWQLQEQYKNNVKLKGKYGLIEIPSSDIMVLYYPEYVKELGLKQQ